MINFFYMILYMVEGCFRLYIFRIILDLVDFLLFSNIWVWFILLIFVKLMFVVKFGKKNLIMVIIVVFFLFLLVCRWMNEGEL